MASFKSRHPIILIVISLLLYLGVILNSHFFRFGLPILQRIWYASSGWIFSTLSYCLIAFALIIGVCLLGFGRLSPSSLGLVRKNLPFAALAVAVTWFAAQIMAAIVSLYFDHRLTAATGPSHSLSVLMAQLFGNALLEETFFRGYLIAALMPYLRKSTTLAVVTSALIFAITHIPFNIVFNNPPILLVGQFVLGVLFGWLYVRTSNLWLCIGLHSLLNAPAFLWASIIPGWLAPISALVLFATFGTRIYRMQQIPTNSMA